ncbi:hypothetical protein OLEAN_C22900 [Oleispira antarctica RB-8]|uniref:Uncharacterized protein n=1 Tax=Oleispira antarctica RB-8 TaxID=698738 RepID=R4YN87_OLEAN|nr:hypothetical protein OLEAN_C22900 [Oleispira antarctica RB-8]
MSRFQFSSRAKRFQIPPLHHSHSVSLLKRANGSALLFRFELQIQKVNLVHAYSWITSSGGQTILFKIFYTVYTCSD